jgi:hypothetical protein
MHHMLFCQGFNSFFKTLAHRLVGNRFDDLQFDRSFGQQSQRPAGVARRLGAAAQRDDFGFFLTIEDLLPREPRLRLTIQGGIQAFEHETLADVLDRANRDPAGFGDGLILPGWSVPAAIRQQQHLSVSPFLRGDFLLFHQFCKLFSFLSVELDNVSLVHRFPSLVSVAEAWLPVFRRAGLHKKDASLS